MAVADYTSLFQEAGKAYNVDPALIRAAVTVESGGNPNAVSEVGAEGLGQLMPKTAKALGVTDSKDPRQNIFGTAKLLDENLKRYGDPETAILAYHGGTDRNNWGPKTYNHLEKVKAAYQGTKMPSTVNTLGEMKSDDAFTAYFSGAKQAAPQGGGDAFTAYFGAPGEAKAATVSAQPAAQPVPQVRSMPDEIARQVGLTARAGATGLSSLPTMLGDALNSAVNYGIRGVNSAAGTNIPQLQMPSQVVQQGLNASGLPQPENATERVVQDVAGAMTGAGSQVALSRALGNAASPVVQSIGNQLAAAPAAQIVGAGASAGGSGAAREGGAGASGQIAAGLAGAVLPVVAGRMLAPQTRPEVTTLMNEGVTPTPGQILGGVAARTEDKARSIPLLGDMITSAQRRGVEDLNRAAYARALQGVPNADIPKSLGREGIDDIAKQLGNAYDDVLGKMKFQADQQFLGDLASVATGVKSLPPKQVDAYKNFLDDNVLSQMSASGAMSGETLKRVEGALTREAKQFSSSPDPFNQKLGQQLQDTLSAFRSSLMRTNPDQAPQLRQLNESYANFARLRDAAGRIGSADGVFTPAQLNSAVRAGDKSVAKGGFARGNALMQDLSGAGVNVLGPKYPDSGTAGRLALATGGAGILGATSPGALLGLGASALAYTPTAQKALAAALVRRPELIRAIGEQGQGFNPAVLGALLSSQGINANTNRGL